MLTTYLRRLLLAASGLAVLPFAVAHQHGDSDWSLLALGGRRLFEAGPHGGLHVYGALPALQVGPLALPAFGGLDAAFGRSADTVAGVVAGGLALLCLYLVEQITGRAVFLAGLVVVPAFVFGVASSAHLEDVAALTLIVVGCWLLANKADPVWVAVTLGAAVAFKPWAVVAAGLLAALPREAIARAVGGYVAAAALWWLPFLFADPAGMHAVASFRFLVIPGSVVHLLGMPAYTHPAGWLRPVQLLLGVVASVAAVRQGRLWAVPLVGLAVRIGLESGAFAYHGMGPVLAAALWDTHRGRRAPVWTFSAGLALYVLPAFSSTTVGAVARLIWVIAVLVVLLRPRRSGQGVTVAEEPVARHVATVTGMAERSFQSTESIVKPPGLFSVQV